MTASSNLVALPWYHQLQIAAAYGFHVALEGPRGVGKTTAVRDYARQRRRELIVVQAHADLSIEDLRGSPGIREGNSIFQYGPVTMAATQGHVLLVDEANLARPGVTAWLNTILDENGFVCVPETGEQISVNTEFRCFLCFNSGYAGNRELNQALLDRCRVIRCDYWPRDVEAQFLHSRVPKLKEIDVTRMIVTATAVRQAREQGGLDFDFSVRTLLQWGVDADQRTQDLIESFRAVVLPKVGDPHQFAAQHQALMELAYMSLR